MPTERNITATEAIAQTAEALYKTQLEYFAAKELAVHTVALQGFSMDEARQIVEIAMEQNDVEIKRRYVERNVQEQVRMMAEKSLESLSRMERLKAIMGGRP